MTYKFLILDTYHPDTLYVRQQGCEYPLLFFEAKRAMSEKVWETLLQTIHNLRQTTQYIIGFNMRGTSSNNYIAVVNSKCGCNNF
jgi:hypothetical protein